MKKLETLILTECSKLCKFPEIQTSMDNLVDLRLKDSGIEVVPSSSGQYCTNLQALDLSGNKFSRLHSSLSQLPRLKYLNVSGCDSLVELPDLPSSIAILIAIGCKSLKVVGDFPTNNLKWLWRVSLSASNCNGERGNAVEDYFISIQFDGTCIPIRGSKLGIFTLLLPPNWCDEFSGFLVYCDDQHKNSDVVITMMDVMGWENEDGVLEVSNEDEEWKRMSGMCYISFSSLRYTSWWKWKSTHTAISFFFKNHDFSSLKVELVPKRSQGDDSIERAKDATNSSEYWDEESKDGKTFEIIHDSKSSIKIEWRQHFYLQKPFHCL
ncbi:hypothetical protein L6452_13197 [Arctium lappa]|uniref:Uncharacterized protein n=1 Tax=Arctium lappa TaxID=4217 RepID=A0ACB9CHG6_ARCLA|nr:hypothetical protein L6452_13197 [Arctium lappa]